MRTSNGPAMRFAYIDSNGNEVPIPSVDALALRIELGAITEQTQLYDAQAEQWGPAHTHEIFHTLSRSSGGGDAFVAPPPVAPPTVGPPAAGVVEDEPSAADAVEPEPAADASAAESGEEDEPEEEDSSFGLTLADAPPAAEDGGRVTDTPEVMADPPVDDEPGSFDFGDMEGGLEVEAPSLEESADAPMSFTGGFGSPPDDEGDDTLDFGGGMELETAPEFGSGGFDASDDPSLDLEAPMSEFSPAAPPSWMDSGEEQETADGVMDFSGVGKASGDTEDEVPLRDRRTPRNKPSPPKLRRQRNLAGPIIGIVALLAVGIGGYVAWPVVSASLTARGEPDEGGMVIPEIPAELEPRMRELAAGALASIYAEERREWASTSRVQAPPRDWLSGVYFANAGDFEIVAEFWHDMRDYLEGVDGVEVAAFDAAFAAQAEARGVPASDATLMRERADSGFVAAAPARAETYARVAGLIDAALRLHQFLVANEEAIEYVPASSVTTDPVLEATAPPEIEAAMHDLLDAVTRGLSVIGYRDQVTADGLWSNVLASVQETGVQ
jgi:hypothetical protein